MKPIIDISNWQGSITHVDWVGLKQHFAAIGIKATEGAHTVDKTYTAHIAGAHSVRLPFTPYHFAHPELHSPIDEARHFAEVIGHTPLQPTLDIEVPTIKNVDLWVRGFNTELRKRLKIVPMIYTFSGYLERFSKPRGNGLWIANYNRNDGKLHPIGSVAPWKHWRLHQYTSKGRTPYVHGYVDLSVARNLQALKAMVWKVSGV